MIRSPNGGVWIQLNGDIEEEGPPPEPDVFDAAAEPPLETGREPDGNEAKS
jgi:hypothetical protein